MEESYKLEPVGKLGSTRLRSYSLGRIFNLAAVLSLLSASETNILLAVLPTMSDIFGQKLC
jgi:hypothetical protein